MKLSETGFRPVYRSYTAFLLNDELKKRIAKFPDAQKADAALVYGYMDPENGLMLEILAAAAKEEGRFQFFSGHSALHETIRAAEVSDTEFFWFPDQDGSLYRRYSLKVDRLKKYIAGEEVETTRYMTFLDEHRDPYFIDDVKVELRRNGLKPEMRTVRITGLEKHWMLGILMEEPEQNFNYHKGESVAFFTQPKGHNRVLLYSDMTPSMSLKAEDLADGSLLKNAAASWRRDRSQSHFVDVLEFLRDSYVYVPCRGLLSPSDEARMKQLIDQARNNNQPVAGMKFTNQDEIRFVPVLMEREGKYYFPVLSSQNEPGDFGKGITMVKKHILEVIPAARNNETRVEGIVLNPFTESFILEARLFDLIEQMKSRLLLQ